MDPGLADRGEDGASGGAALQVVAHRGRRTPVAIAVAAIAVLAAALLTKSPAPTANVPTASVAPGQSPAGPPTSSRPIVAIVAAPTPGAPGRNPAVTPHPTFRTVAASAGLTPLIPAGSTPVRLTISLPGGWAKAGGAMYVKANGAAPAVLSISAWSLRDVNTFPCRWSAQAFADPLLMRTAQGQAEALSSWWGQDPRMPPLSNSRIAPLASEPRPTTVLGYPAWSLDVLIPSDLDLGECDGGQLVLWEAANGEVRSDEAPGEINRLCVVDVHGEPIVIDAAAFLTSSAADVAELQAVVDSLAIVP